MSDDNRSNPRKTLRRTYGLRELVNGNGQAVVPPKAPRRLMFASTVNVRPFNFRNATVEARHTNSNTRVPLVNGRNARGDSPKIPLGDPRLNPAFKEAIGTNPTSLRASMIANRESLQEGIKKFKQKRATGENMFHLPVMSVFHAAQSPINRFGPKQARIMAAQYNLGHPVPELNQLAMEGAPNEYIAEEAELLAANYRNQADYNAEVAQRAAKINANVAKEIEKEIANAAGPKSRRNRRSRKTRRNRK